MTLPLRPFQNPKAEYFTDSYFAVAPAVMVEDEILIGVMISARQNLPPVFVTIVTCPIPSPAERERCFALPALQQNS